MGRIKKPAKQKSSRLSSLAVLDDLRRVNKILSVDFEGRIVSLLEGLEKLHVRIGQYRDDNNKLRKEKLQYEETIECLKTSLDKTYRELEEEARQRSLVERRLRATEQQLDFIRQILNERGGPEDALEQARLALIPNRIDNRRSRTSSGQPIRPSTNFSLSAGSLLDPEDVSHDRSFSGGNDVSRLRGRRSTSEPPLRDRASRSLCKKPKRSSSEMNIKRLPNSGRVYKSPILSGGGSPFSHMETLSGPGVVTSQTRVTVTDDKRTHVDTEVRVERSGRNREVSAVLAEETQHGILSAEESEYGRKIAKMTGLPASTPSVVSSAVATPGTHSTDSPSKTRKRASDDSQDSYFGLPVKKLVTEEAIGEQVNTNRPCTPSDKTMPSTPVGTPFTGGRMGKSGSASRLTRSHAFITKPILRLETCVACNKRIKFGKTALKCSECKSMVHHDCRDKAPQPCIPASHHGRTPVSKTGCVRLTELCPANEIPQIPGVVIHCVNEVETRGLSQEGIYRVSGTDKQVKDLLDRFLRGRPPYPSLSSVEDIHVVCGCIKLFLRRLSEPLVTYQLWATFADLAESIEKQHNKNEVLNSSTSDSVTRTRVLLQQLPRPNRDTLVFLLLHLQRVSQSNKCNMGIDNLAKVLGPTLIGYSCPEPEPLQAINETRSQQAVMRCFLMMPEELYRSILQPTESTDSPIITGRVFDTPLLRETTSVSSGSSAVNTPFRRMQGGVRKPVFEPLFEPLP